MDKYQEIIELLRNNNVDFREQGDELLLHCMFSDCDSDSRGLEAHLYINKITGLYDCKKCGEKGNLVALKQHFGVLSERKAQPKRLSVISSDRLQSMCSLILEDHGAGRRPLATAERPSWRAARCGQQ